MSKESQSGLNFRQELMKYMPPGIVSWDHAEAVNGARAGPGGDDHRMVGVLSATLTDPKTSKIGDCLGVAPEPSGEAGRLPALGGFSLAVASQAPETEQKASVDLHPVGDLGRHRARLTSTPAAFPAARRSMRSPAIKAKYKFVEPMVASWQKGVPEFRPRFPAWPAISEIIAEFGSKMMLGETSVEQGSKEIGTRMEAILKKEGYYDGKKPLLQ